MRATILKPPNGAWILRWLVVFPCSILGEDSPSTLRVGTFNVSLSRPNPGQLTEELSGPKNAQAKVIAEIVQRVRPDLLLLNEFDFDPTQRTIDAFRSNYLQVGQNGAAPIFYEHTFIAPVNTGIDSGLDLDRNGVFGEPNDAFGFGKFAGQYGMVVLSRYPIEKDRCRTFQNFLWRDMPDSLMPVDYYGAEARQIFRLSSKSHWDVVVHVEGLSLHLLASHPTPPVFDGPEDRNGRRNHDEIRFWVDYLTPEKSGYIYDDKGKQGGIMVGEPFVVLGDLNCDPHDGDGRSVGIRGLLTHPEISTDTTPDSLGAKIAALEQGQANRNHESPAEHDTADLNDRGPGNLRVDYVLPSRLLSVRKAKVFWPEPAQEAFRLVGTYDRSLGGNGFPSSDHRMVWLELQLPQTFSLE